MSKHFFYNYIIRFGNIYFASARPKNRFGKAEGSLFGFKCPL